MLIKTDAATPDIVGDHMNPFGAMTFGSQPSEIKLINLGNATYRTGEWQTTYKRTIPAGGEVSIAVVYTDDFTLPLVKARSAAALKLVAAPSVAIESPADDSTIDAATAHVTGTASSADGQTSVTVNGVAATLTPDGHWATDVPLNEGTNSLLAVASNALGVTTTAIRSVTRPAVAPAPAAATTEPPAGTTPTALVTAKPVHCVVPKLRGKTLPKAKRLLKRAHCGLGKVVRKASTKVKPGRVVATRFRAGTRHRAGTRIRVTVAKAR
jgi:hypothetical protein